MLSAVDVPKSKSITIAFTALKSSILALLFTITFRELAPQLSPQPSSSSSPSPSSPPSPQCSDTLLQLSIIFKLFFILSSSLDLCLLFYFLCTQTFKRIQYYILFGFHLLLFFILGIVALVQVFKSDDCVLKGIYLGGCFCLLLIFVVLALLVMYCNLYFGLKFVHFGGGIFWTFLWLQALSCGNVLLAFIGIIHGVLSVFGFVVFVIMNMIKKNSMTAKCWRQLYILSIVVLLLCYILSFIAEGTLSNQCIQGKLLTRTYQKYGLIQIISPILLLVFLNTQLGDPRDAILREEIKGVKGKGRFSGENIQIDETN